MAAEDQNGAGLEPGNGLEARQADLLAFAGRKPGAEVKETGIEPFPNQFRSQTVGGMERMVLILKPGAVPAS